MIASRLKSEYGVVAQIEPAAYAAARWVGEVEGPLPTPGGGSVMAVDRQDRRVILFASDWELRYFERHHPKVPLLSESPVGPVK